MSFIYFKFQTHVFEPMFAIKISITTTFTELFTFKVSF